MIARMLVASLRHTEKCFNFVSFFLDVNLGINPGPISIIMLCFICKLPSGIAKVGHTGARAPPVQVCLSSIGTDCHRCQSQIAHYESASKIVHHSVDIYT